MSQQITVRTTQKPDGTLYLWEELARGTDDTGREYGLGISVGGGTILLHSPDCPWMTIRTEDLISAYIDWLARREPIPAEGRMENEIRHQYPRPERRHH